MTLSTSYTEAYGKLPDFFSKIRDGQAPPQFTNQYLQDLGFRSTKDRSFIPILKSLGFLTPDGKPTQRYKDYRDHSKSKQIMGEALKEAYADIFLIKAKPAESDQAAVEGKFKSYNNASDNTATNMRRTFYALLKLADLHSNPIPASPPSETLSDVTQSGNSQPASGRSDSQSRLPVSPGLHYNIQIHLPATKDVEVYNAIFKSLKEHLY